jgi:dihydropyrimidine dehydrogenase (NAD+) subunit PreA
MVVDLSTSYAGLEIKNPIMGGSAPGVQLPEISEKGYRAGAAGLVMKTSFQECPDEFTKEMRYPFYRLADINGLEVWRPIPPKKSDPLIRGKKGVMRPGYTMVMIPHGNPGAAFWLGDDYIRGYNEIKARLGDDCLLVPSIYAATDEEWKEQCRRVREMKAQVVELNLACPIIAGWSGLKLSDAMKVLQPGEPPGANTEISRDITKLCVDNLDIPVVVKFTPFSFSNVATALAVQEVGAQGIMLADSVTAPMLRIDPETASPGWHPGLPTTGGGWGPWIISYLCGQIYRMRKAGVKIDITGCGGIQSSKDILRYIMAGASTVQVARTIMVEGWGVVGVWLEELTQWMERKGYKSITEIKGIAADKVKGPDELPPMELSRYWGGEPTAEMVIDEKKCIGCGWCFGGCMYCAIELIDEHAVIMRDKCDTCGMCESVCPVGAIIMRRT